MSPYPLLRPDASPASVGVRDPFLTGKFLVNDAFGGWAAFLQATTANRAYAVLFRTPRACLAKSISPIVTTGDAGAPTCEARLHNAAGTEIATTGSLSGQMTSAGNPALAFTTPVWLAPQTLYIAQFATAGTPTLLFANYQSGTNSVRFGNTVGTRLADFAAALASPWVGSSGGISAVPLLTLTEG